MNGSRKITSWFRLTGISLCLLLGMSVAAQAQPGFYFKLDMMPECLDPYDVFFDCNLFRFSRPGEWLEVPQPLESMIAEGPLSSFPSGVVNISIEMIKEPAGEWQSPADPFYANRRLEIELDGQGRLLSAEMKTRDTTELTLFRRNCLYSGNGHLLEDTLEIYRMNSFFGVKRNQPLLKDGKQSVETVRTRLFIYDERGKLIRMDYRINLRSGWLTHQYDNQGRRVKTSAFTSEEKPYCEVSYRYDEQGRLLETDWVNPSGGHREMYHSITRDKAGRVTNIRFPWYPAGWSKDDRLVETPYTWNGQGQLLHVDYRNGMYAGAGAGFGKYGPTMPIDCRYDGTCRLQQIRLEPPQLGSSGGGLPGAAYLLNFSYDAK